MDKPSGGVHRTVEMTRLGEDEHGIWLAAPKGAVVTMPGRGSFVTGHLSVRLVPRDRWWNALFIPAPSEIDIYCDVATPAVWDGDTVRMTDLDLDVVRYREDRRIELMDEDEFVVSAHPTDIVEAARASAAELRHLISTSAEPFGEHHRRWLNMTGSAFGRQIGRPSAEKGQLLID